MTEKLFKYMYTHTKREKERDTRFFGDHFLIGIETKDFQMF